MRDRLCTQRVQEQWRKRAVQETFQEKWEKDLWPRCAATCPKWRALATWRRFATRVLWRISKSSMLDRSRPPQRPAQVRKDRNFCWLQTNFCYLLLTVFEESMSSSRFPWKLWSEKIGVSSASFSFLRYPALGTAGKEGECSSERLHFRFQERFRSWRWWKHSKAFAFLLLEDFTNCFQEKGVSESQAGRLFRRKCWTRSLVIPRNVCSFYVLLCMVRVPQPVWIGHVNNGRVGLCSILSSQVPKSLSSLDCVEWSTRAACLAARDSLHVALPNAQCMRSRRRTAMPSRRSVPPSKWRGDLKDALSSFLKEKLKYNI